MQLYLSLVNCGRPLSPQNIAWIYKGSEAHFEQPPAILLRHPQESEYEIDPMPAANPEYLHIPSAA